MYQQDEALMRRALELAQSAADRGNEPFGALLVRDGSIVMTQENQVNSLTDPTCHAGHGLLRRFCQETGQTDLADYTLYTSCEPCFMCSGAMVWTRLGRLVFSAYARDLDAIVGAPEADTSQIVFAHSNWAPQVTGGVLREEGIRLLRDYFGR